MKISSRAFANNRRIPLRYSYKGGNLSPPLNFRKIPEDAKSLAIICHDPDAPTEGGFTHWVVFNIPPTTKGFEENSTVDGAVTGTNDYGTNSWGGPAPPSGTHRYSFNLYVLDTLLDLPASANRTQLLTAMQGHIICESNLVGLFAAS